MYIIAKKRIGDILDNYNLRKYMRRDNSVDVNEFMEDRIDADGTMV